MGSESLNILRVRDISLSGLGVHAPHGFRDADLASEVDLVITLPGSRSFLAKGIVRHRTSDAGQNFFGVEFTSLKAAHREEIRRFIRRLSDLDAAV